MSAAWMVATLLVVLAAWWTAPARRDASMRLFALSPQRPTPMGASRPAPPHRPSVPLRLTGAGGAGGVAYVVLGGGSPVLGLLVALTVAAATWWSFGRLEPAAQRRVRQEVTRDLPFAVDLFASCVAAGAPTATALHLAGAGVDGPIGDAFAAAAAAMRLGAPAVEAVGSWRTDRALEPLEPMARVLVRSATSGVALVPAATRLANDLRDARRWQVDAVARRVGVRATAPLGVCFLPAFVVLGIAPVVIAGAHGMGV